MTSPGPGPFIARVTFVVRDYDDAIAFFTRVLRFELVEDTYMPEQDKRWVVVAPRMNALASNAGRTAANSRSASGPYMYR